MVSRVPLIVVLGATGTGKSKLAVELAKKFGGEIISADSMQVYRGLDVITNKVTTEEMDGVPHHLLDFVDPLDRYTVVDFRNKALPIIDRLISSGKLPVVVGGTNYYIESILWKILIEEPSGDEESLLYRRGEDIVREDDLAGGKAVLGPGQRARLAAAHITRLIRYSESVFMRLLATLKRNEDIVVTDETDPEEHHRQLMYCISEFARDVNEKYDGKFVWCWTEMESAEKEMAESLGRLGEKLNFKVPKGARQSDVSLNTPPTSRFPDLRPLVTREFNPFATLATSAEELTRRVEAMGDDQCLEVEDFLEKSVLEVEASVWGRVGGVADAVGKRAEADLNNVSSQLLHDRLQQLDPDMAEALHPNNKRKIFRSLQVLAQKGKTHSALLEEQRGQSGGCQLGGPLRYPNTAILWLHAQTEVLNSRLDARVDDMIRRGLVQELLDFHKSYNESRLKSDSRSLGEAYTQGIFQSIGFKEFHNYLVLSDEDRQTETGRMLLEEGVEGLKLVTRKYAKKQNKWVRNRFLRSANRQVPPVYGLDTTDVGQWEEAVLGPAEAIVKSLLSAGETSEAGGLLHPLPRDPSPRPSSSGRHYCEECDRIFIGTIQWEAHLQSKKHKTSLKKKAPTS